MCRSYNYKIGPLLFHWHWVELRLTCMSLRGTTAGRCGLVERWKQGHQFFQTVTNDVAYTEVLHSTANVKSLASRVNKPWGCITKASDPPHGRYDWFKSLFTAGTSGSTALVVNEWQPQPATAKVRFLRKIFVVARRMPALSTCEETPGKGAQLALPHDEGFYILFYTDVSLH